MADLKKLSRRIAATKAKKAEVPKPLPKIDRSQEKAIKTSQESITGALVVGFKSLEALLKKLVSKEVVVLDEKVIEKAVIKGMEKAKPQEIIFPVREPVSYRATIERRGKEMIGALIEPIIGRK